MLRALTRGAGHARRTAAAAALLLPLASPAAAAASSVPVVAARAFSSTAAATPSTPPSSSAASSSPSSPTGAGVVRVRYAPSPTGSLHLGGLRTALYNFLLARQAQSRSPSHPDPSPPLDPKSSFLLRIEDTDQKRLVPGAVEQLTRSLSWAGLEVDEGPHKPGTVGPYVQSERLEIYRRELQPLLQAGHAYPCFCTPERLTALRDAQNKKGTPSMYDRLCLHMSDAEREQKLKEHQEQGKPYVIRMKIPSGTTVVKDLIRGVVSFPNKTLDDQILLKSDGFPTYHWACVVDDHLMRVSHVVRGEEWLTSTPKHLILYRMRGWEAPRFAHLPLLLKPDGSKLSKRHDDSSLDWYVARGYLPEAVVNFVALLGWNPGSTQEVFTMQQLIESFRVERIQKAGAVVNRDKLDWFNQQHIGIMARERMGELVHLVKPKILAHHRPTSADATQTSASDADLADESFLRRILASLASHVTHVHDFVSQSLLFYCPPRLDDPASDAPIHALRAKVYPDEAATQLNLKLLDSTISQLQTLPDSAFDIFSSYPPSHLALQSSLKTVLQSHGAKQKQLFLLLRFLLTGVESGPSISLIIAAMGRERTLQRLQAAKKLLHP